MAPRRKFGLAAALCLAVAVAVPTIGSSTRLRAADPDEVSPARRIRRPLPQPARPRAPARWIGEFRSIDGSGNHPDDPERNAAGTPLLRLSPPDYADGHDAMAGSGRPSPRVVSNQVSAQHKWIATPYRTSDYLWQWGQFLDHDLDLTDGVDPPQPAPIAVPAGDPYFDPSGSGDEEIAFNRSIYSEGSSPREQLNEATGWIDASNMYGSDPEREAHLRSLDGSGRLRTSPGDLLPLDDGSQPNATGGSQQVMFLAGDARANEQVALTAMHTLFVREHNRIADRIRQRRPWLSGEEVYQRARRRVGALMQVVTYREFLPALLGEDLPPYRGYDANVDARICNEFSTAAYRFGHSALSRRLLRLDAQLRSIPAGPLALRDAFFQPDRIRYEGGIDPLLRGLAHQTHQAVDVQVINEVRNFLFGPPGAGGFDLVSLNLQRGRDHGLLSYNDMREAFGLPRVRRFAEINPRKGVRRRLSVAYASVDKIDAWIGGLAEHPVEGSQLGALFTYIVRDQFLRLRDGDRFWYQRTLGERERRAVEATRLSDIIRRNTGIGEEIPDDVFRVRGRGKGDRGPGRR